MKKIGKIKKYLAMIILSIPYRQRNLAKIDDYVSLMTSLTLNIFFRKLKIEIKIYASILHILEQLDQRETSSFFEISVVEFFCRKLHFKLSVTYEHLKKNF